MHEDGTGVGFVSTEKGEQGAGENGGQMLTLRVSPDMMIQLVGKQDILRTAIAGIEISGIIADWKGDAVTYRRVECRWDESSGAALNPCSPKMEDVDDL